MAHEGRYKIGYARVSTREQNLQLQLDALVAAGVSEDAIHTDVATGATMNRPGLKAALMNLRRGDVFVVWKLDRLSRKLEDALKLANQIGDKGAHLQSLTQEIDTTTAGGRLIFHLFAMLADFERGVSNERTIAGLAAARARGRVGGRQPVYTAEQRRAAMQLLKEGATVREAAAKVGVSRPAVYKWRKMP